MSRLNAATVQVAAVTKDHRIKSAKRVMLLLLHAGFVRSIQNFVMNYNVSKEMARARGLDALEKTKKNEKKFIAVREEAAVRLEPTPPSLSRTARSSIPLL